MSPRLGTESDVIKRLSLKLKKVQNARYEHRIADVQLHEIVKRALGFTARSMFRDTPEDIYKEDLWQANISDEDSLYDFEHLWDEELRKRSRKEKEPLSSSHTQGTQDQRRKEKTRVKQFL
ncbi:hypothetical protein BGZ49_002603 [Haplosporangium sp. Z 27]|nr:hypothetical protein BGZ49_002603 [Haplosporangium sp. Z 27]